MGRCSRPLQSRLDASTLDGFGRYQAVAGAAGGLGAGEAIYPHRHRELQQLHAAESAVDSVDPEADKAREFAAMVDRFLAAKSSDRQDEVLMRNWLGR